MTEARTGYGGEFWLGDEDDELVELVEVVSFTLPNAQTETVEATHLKSPGRRREYIPGMIEDGELEVVINYVPGSATDALIRAAQTAGDTRAFKAVLPRSTTDWEVEGFVIVTGFDRGEIAGGEKMEGTITLRLTGATTEAAAA
ncbi:phage tail tube protein [Allosphingosinicella indica]|uniref:Lambda phage tail tube protein N-terminal domain-containing protein n=1 Tax=Allosphingosinicella indica TaxID=941907 RepID=A0A1X7GJ81_9SPHN|nr:phage tail tube protein [Allosphingosinicella indica]SMF70520.1 hypothetical protein SAMN06295910_1893 [Allosphingosinicella indica]